MDNTLPRAKQLRKTMTTSERKLWNLLRRHPDLNFRRQHPLGPYIADFYCPAANTVIELDGETHRSRRDEDAARDTWLQSNNIHTLRLSVSAFERNTSGCLQHILQECRNRLP